MAADLTILVPTHDRPHILARTLERMASCRLSGLTVDLCVVDYSTEDGGSATRELCEGVEGPVRPRFLHAEGESKNRALNQALEQGELGAIVVFTEDDVEPDLRWFVQIVEACRDAPDYAVFGGRVDVAWPEIEPPKWARGEAGAIVRELGFAEHAPRIDSGPYPMGRVPVGANFWLRRGLFAEGYRFDESIGDQTGTLILGDEVPFLRKLSVAGQTIGFAARAVVGRRVTPEMLDPASVRRTAFQRGRGIPYETGMPMRDLLSKSPTMWRLVRRLLILRDRARVAVSHLQPGVAPSLVPLRTLGANLESLRLSLRAGR